MPLSKSIYLRALYLIAFLIFVLRPHAVCAQQGTAAAPVSEASSLQDSIRQMQLQIQQMQVLLHEMKEDAERSRTETLELKHELQLTREKLNSMDLSANTPAAKTPAPQTSAETGPTQESPAEEKSVAERVAKLEEDQQLAHNEIDEQHQTKVESAAKRRVKLSGILLMNVFSNQGNPDHFEVPGVALPTTPSATGGNTGGSFGATFRQSEIGLQIYGPTIAGAKTSGDVVADFFGEFPETVNGSSSGSFRLRTGTIHLDWAHTSVVGGVDSLFFSPLYPTSFASVGIPALSYAGNLWGWLPQLRVEHRLLAREDSTLTISAGIFDPLTGEAPQNEFLRIAGAGESSRQPGYAGRLQWARKISGQPFALGVGGYYNRENWGFNRNVDGFAATTDWIVPFGQYFSLSGQFYGGRAIGGLGAGIGRSIDFNGILSTPTATISPLESIGGWSQIKIKPAAKIEFNIAAGQDSVPAGDVHGFNQASGYFAANLTRNRSEFANFIYRPRSSLLFSTEFRTLRTFTVDGTSQRVNQVNLVMGVLF
jgi:hypothetical protein